MRKGLATVATRRHSQRQSSSRTLQYPPMVVVANNGRFESLVGDNVLVVVCWLHLHSSPNLIATLGIIPVLVVALVFSFPLLSESVSQSVVHNEQFQLCLFCGLVGRRKFNGVSPGTILRHSFLLVRPFI